jgi:pimeloyl-ACP methyl ester carboxylesterase
MDQKSSGAHSVRSSQKRRKIFVWVGISVVLLLVAAFLGVSAFAACMLTMPMRNFNPELNPAKYGLKYEALSIPARTDGLQIAAWYIPSDENQRVIILVHGYNNSRTNGFLDEFVSFAASLQQAGFSVMMVDLRGHGESAEARFTFGITERRDVLGAVDWLEEHGYQPGKIGVLGYSLGAGSVVGAAADEPDIGAVWVDSLFADIKPVIQDGVTAAVGLPQVLVPSTISMVRLMYGYDITALRPIDEITKIAPRPIFMAHCQEDKLIPISNMDQLSQVAQNSQTWVIPNCDIHTMNGAPAIPESFNNHAIGYVLNPEEYTQNVVEFFDTNLY